MDPDIERSDPQRLAKLLALGTAEGRVWQAGELGAIFRHQMSSVVQFDLAAVDPALGDKLSTLAAAEGLLVRSFSDLLHHPHPPLELLILTKQFAKAMMNHPDSPLPEEIGRLLYLASIAAALVRCGRRITDLDDASLRSGLEWGLSQPWIDAGTQGILKTCLEYLDASSGSRT